MQPTRGALLPRARRRGLCPSERTSRRIAGGTRLHGGLLEAHAGPYAAPGRGGPALGEGRLGFEGLLWVV
eukprot:14545548-Alexandrium_andersonii.AAC.1